MACLLIVPLISNPDYAALVESREPAGPIEAEKLVVKVRRLSLILPIQSPIYRSF